MIGENWFSWGFDTICLDVFFLRSCVWSEAGSCNTEHTRTHAYAQIQEGSRNRFRFIRHLGQFFFVSSAAIGSSAEASKASKWVLWWSYCPTTHAIQFIPHTRTFQLALPIIAHKGTSYTATIRSIWDACILVRVDLFVQRADSPATWLATRVGNWIIEYTGYARFSFHIIYNGKRANQILIKKQIDKKSYGFFHIFSPRPSKVAAGRRSGRPWRPGVTYRRASTRV